MLAGGKAGKNSRMAKTKAFLVGHIHRRLKSRTNSHECYSCSMGDNLKVKQLAICGDEELASLIKAMIADGGIIPHIHKSLVGEKGQEKTVLTRGAWVPYDLRIKPSDSCPDWVSPGDS
ncbi:unnamed protein product [Nyctereutes procyonoides]|uniref:(raccoon dog) hypothetical protein n=1 Tax=Nyctereutes procyonoides TaxID=34880 RepID=A0A811Z7N0_NYCPR|nr:unnamed protein product [Nyctereutes procyonoides]